VRRWLAVRGLVIRGRIRYFRQSRIRKDT